MTKIYVFPGQGSQTIGMGKELFDQFAFLIKQADQILGYSIKQLCLEDPDKKLNSTDYTQPALYIVNSLMYLKKVQQSGKPDFVAGHSLGEYNALFAAEVFDFATGLKLVQKRGAIMSKAEGGGMGAVIGLAPEKIKEALKNTGLESIDIANFNSPGQTVISGPKADIGKLTGVFEKAGARLFVPLAVSGAFHSRYMKPAKEEFEKYLEQFTFKSPKIPVIANYTAKKYDDNVIKENLALQICNPVRWVETVMFLKQQPNAEFEEIGPGKVLTKLIAQI
ncbi:MAG: ACP S-malonyltransferase [Spirochaetes bacterium]|nr:ACP S-malonyltransferase [Spirochaetota bacterium]